MSNYPISCNPTVYLFQIMNLERQLLGIFSAGNYCIRYINKSLYYKTVLWFGRDKMYRVVCRFRNMLLWLHTVFAVLYLILTVVLLRRHTSQIKGMRRETVSH